MRMERIYIEATISKSLVSGGQWETDENGNPIVIIEASNDNLDYDGERVMQSALMGSKDYFLKNGVISYDHKHLLRSPENLQYDPKWNAEKYILGKPLKAWVGKGANGRSTVLVKAALSKTNEIAKQIIGKLKDKIGTVRASVGGRRPEKTDVFNPETYEITPTIIAVDWDEVALTYKPVNQTLGPTILSPKEFVKSLTAGSSADPGNMGTGGNTLQMQSGEKDIISALITKFKNKEIKKSKDAINYLVDSGMSKEKASGIIKVMINKLLGVVSMADQDQEKTAVESPVDELEKALSELDEGMEKGMADGKYVRKGGYMYKMKAGGGYEAMDDDAPEYKEDDDKDEEKVKKSVDDETLLYDAEQDFVEIKKSMNTLVEQNEENASMVKSLFDVIGKQNAVIKALGNATKEEMTLLKSIADAPLGRVTGGNKLTVTPRFEKAQTDKIKSLDAGLLMKSMIENEIAPLKRNIVAKTFSRLGVDGLIKAHPDVVEALVKE